MEDAKTLARARRQQMMLEDPMIRVIPAIAIPMIISAVIDSIYNLADTFFVSGLGEAATAAVIAKINAAFIVDDSTKIRLTVNEDD